MILYGRKVSADSGLRTSLPFDFYFPFLPFIWLASVGEVNIIKVLYYSYGSTVVSELDFRKTRQLVYQLDLVTYQMILISKCKNSKINKRLEKRRRRRRCCEGGGNRILFLKEMERARSFNKRMKLISRE